MSAEVLREAAALMRERAEAATPGPWFTHEEHGRDYADEGWSYVATITRSGAEVTATAYPGGPDHGHDAQADAEHIASWPPAVAFAVADWLEFYAFTFESREAAKGDVPSAAVNPFALAVARAYLGSDS